MQHLKREKKVGDQQKSFPWYTASGDDGSTSLLGDERVPKYHPQPEAYGTVDEASAALGLARSLAGRPEVKETLLSVQRDLYQIMSELAATPAAASRFRSIDAERVAWLSQMTDHFGEQAHMPREFVVPGETPAGAALDLARTVVRRAERRTVQLMDIGRCANPEIVRYLNRLSSLCFVLARLEDNSAGGPPTLAKEQ
jgi:cob(I)alamin adenosyltransferase